MMKVWRKTGSLLALNLRKDRAKILVWLVVMVGVFVAVAAKFEALYGTPSQIASISATLKSPAMVALFGTLPNGGALTTATIFAGEMLVFWAILLIICNFNIVIASSRDAEENGTLELLLGAEPIGRGAPVCAAILELAVVDGLFIGLTALGTNMADLPGRTSAGSWLFAVVLGLVGFAFGMVALTISQLATDSRMAITGSYLFFGLTYAVRMVADVQNPAYTWWSPLGWIEKTALYTQDNWLPVLYLGLFAIFFGLLALFLAYKRDLNRGLLPSHRRQASSRALLGPGTFIWKLEKNSAIIWFIGMLLLGMMYGAIFNSVGKLVQTSQVLRQVLGTTGIAHLEKVQLLSYLNLLGLIFTLLAVVGALFVSNRLFQNEPKGYTNLLQTRPISRGRWYGTYLGFSILLAAVLLFAALAGAMLAGNAVLKQPLALHYFVWVGLSMWPIALLFITMNSLWLGWWPKGRQISWLLLAGSFIISYFGKLIDLPEWGLNLSPFYWVRHVPLEAPQASLCVLLVCLSAALLMLGALGYQRRALQVQ